jgi:RNA 3'-terminal phosphate cyclase-like protein
MVTALSNSSLLHFSGHEHLRQRLILSALSGKSVRIDSIRPEDEQLGILDYEASFLRLLDKITNGSSIEINYTGTCITFVPGVLSGGKIHHDCPPSRSIGYFLEAVIALAPFCKNPLALSLTGITNDNLDPSVNF